MTGYGRFFLPGPTEVHPDVLDAMKRPMIGHRSADMQTLLSELSLPLRDVFQTREQVLIGACSATGFMEMAVRNGVRDRCLSVVGGSFGARFAQIAASCGKDVVRLDVEAGHTVEADQLRDQLRRTPVDAVTLVHSETSTGALAPLEELAEVIRTFDDITLLVDTVTSMAGSPVLSDAWRLDFVLTGSQKAFALPPGLAFGCASPRMRERAASIEHRGYYFDLLAFEKAFEQAQPTNTPAISLLYALAKQLERLRDEGGIEARWGRHEAMRRRVEAWVEEANLGLRFLPPPGRRSWTVSCLTLPDGVSAKTVVRALHEEGITIGTGYGPLKDTSIRIGHMGDHTVDELDAVLAALEQVLS